MLQDTALIQNRYELTGELMKCRFSTLHRAVDRATGTALVIRVLDQSLQGDSPDSRKDVRTQIMREGRYLSTLQHRNLPRVIDIIEDREQVFLLMDDLQGQTVEAFVEGNKEPADERILRRLFDQLLSVLGYLHGSTPPIIHRDLRPDSVLISPRGLIKLAEFGLAKMAEPDGKGGTLFRAMGSQIYAPPEQLMQSPSDPRNDIYSLGALFYYMATRKAPQKSLERMRDPSGDVLIRELNPAISGEMTRMIARMMAPSMEKRFATVEELRESYVATFPVDTSSSLHIPSVILERKAPKEDGEKKGAAPKQEGSAGPAIWNEIVHLAGYEADLNLPHAAAPLVAAPSEKDLARFPFVDLRTIQIERDTGRLLPENISKSIEGVCIGKRTSSEITLAVKDPSQVYIYDHVSFSTKGRYKPVLVRAEPLMIDLAREFVYKTAVPANSWLEWLEMKKFAEDRLDVKQKAEDLVILGNIEDLKGPAIEAVDRIIKEAISIGASDIHMENFEHEMVVRYRLDGVLHVVESFDHKMAMTITKRLKIIAGMDISVDRVTQGGRLSVRVKDRDFDLRISIVPVPHGENIVMRLLNKGAFNYRLSDLGFQKEEEDKYLRLLNQPHGMILVSGPTGSGKSTTLYASLSEINKPDRKLLTVEDPIEYEMPGITQVQVNVTPREDDKKVTFARALREFLRQDPDAILVGEIRDTETAAIAVQAALTGHLLLSTIHTNDSLGIVTRLEDMEVEPYLISSTLVGGIAQRLVRRICRDCMEEMPVEACHRELFDSCGIDLERLFRGKGCLKCRNTGYRGRVALYEILEVTPELRSMIAAGAAIDDMRSTARSQGMSELRQDGLRKVAQGLTSFDEIKRVTMSV